jgi:micrococcal nuclease
MNRTNRKLVRSILILIAMVWGGVELILNKPWTSDNEIVKVLSVKDGDSIVVSTKKGSKDLRIWGIDAPEKGQPYANLARKRLEELILNKEVRIQKPKTDSFHRDLAFLSISNSNNTNWIDVGSIILSQGLAWHFNPDPEHNKPYQKLENDARKQKIGLWADSNPQKPEDYRRAERNKSSKTFKLN